MKKILVITVLCLVSYMAKSQDVIVKMDGKKIKSKDIVIDDHSVKFNIHSEYDKQIQSIREKIKKFKKDNLPVDQQVFTIPKKEVFMINYENDRNNFMHDKISTRAIISIQNIIDANTNPEEFKEFRTGHKRYSTGRGLVGAGGGIFAFGTLALIINSTNGKHDNNSIGASYVFMGIGACLLGAGLPVYFSGIKKMNHAYDSYKKSLKTSQNNYHFDFGLTQNGVGLNMKF